MKFTVVTPETLRYIRIYYKSIKNIILYNNTTETYKQFVFEDDVINVFNLVPDVNDDDDDDDSYLYKWMFQTHININFLINYIDSNLDILKIHINLKEDIGGSTYRSINLEEFQLLTDDIINQIRDTHLHIQSITVAYLNDDLDNGGEIFRLEKLLFSSSHGFSSINIYEWVDERKLWEIIPELEYSNLNEMFNYLLQEPDDIRFIYIKIEYKEIGGSSGGLDDESYYD